MYGPKFEQLIVKAQAGDSVSIDADILYTVLDDCKVLDMKMHLLNNLYSCQDVPSLFDFKPQEQTSCTVEIACFNVNTDHIYSVDEYVQLCHRLCAQVTAMLSQYSEVDRQAVGIGRWMARRRDTSTSQEPEFVRFVSDLNPQLTLSKSRVNTLHFYLHTVRRYISVMAPFGSLYVLLCLQGDDLYMKQQNPCVSPNDQKTPVIVLLKQGNYQPIETAQRAYSCIREAAEKQQYLQRSNNMSNQQTVHNQLVMESLPSSLFESWFLALQVEKHTEWYGPLYHEYILSGEMDQDSDSFDTLQFESRERVDTADKTGFIQQSDGTYRSICLYARLASLNSKDSRTASKDRSNMMILLKLQKVCKLTVAQWQCFLKVFRERQYAKKVASDREKVGLTIDQLHSCVIPANKYIDALINASNAVIASIGMMDPVSQNSYFGDGDVYEINGNASKHTDKDYNNRKNAVQQKRNVPNNPSLADVPTIPVTNTTEIPISQEVLDQMAARARTLGVPMDGLRLAAGYDVVNDIEADAIPDYSNIDFSYLRLGAQPIRPTNGIPDKLFFSLYSFQLASVDFCLKRRGRCLLGDEMGCGKTLTAQACMTQYRDEWPVLIIAPTTLRYNWIHELFKWCNEVVDFRNVQMIHSAKDPIHVGLNRGDKSIIICSYNMCTSMMDTFYNSEIGMVVVDESHYLKSFNSKRTKSLMPLIRKVPRALLLSGTPMLSRTEEIYTQIHALKPHVFCHLNIFCKRYNAKDLAGLLETMDNCLQSIKDTVEMLEMVVRSDSRSEKVKIYQAELKMYTKQYHDAAVKYNAHRAVLHELLYMQREHVVIRRLKRQVVTELEPKSRAAVNAVLKKDDKNEINKTYARFFKLMPYLTTYLRERDQKQLFDVGQSTFESHLLDEDAENVENDENETIFGMKEEELVEQEEEPDGPDPLAWLTNLEAKLSSTGGALSKNEQRRVFMKLYELTGVLKVPFVLEYISDQLETGKKFVVFAHHKHVVNEICRQLEEKKVRYFKIDGSVSMEDRQTGVQAFQRDSGLRVAVLSITSAGVGLTLTKANLAVFAELYWNPSMLLQAEDRQHRVGQTDPVNIQYLLASHSLDSLIWPRLLQKMEIIGNAMDGSTDKGFHDADRQNEAGGLGVEELAKLADNAGMNLTLTDVLASKKKHQEALKKKFYKPNPDCTAPGYTLRGQNTCDEIVERWAVYNDINRGKQTHTNTVPDEAQEGNGKYEGMDEKGRAARFYYHVKRLNAKRKANYPIGAIPGWYAPQHQRLLTWDSFDPQYTQAQHKLNVQLGIIPVTKTGLVLRSDVEEVVIRKNTSAGSTSEQVLINLAKEVQRAKPLKVIEEDWARPGACVNRAKEYLALLRLAWQEGNMASLFETEMFVRRRDEDTLAVNSYHEYIQDTYVRNRYPDVTHVNADEMKVDKEQLLIPHVIPYSRYGPRTPLMIHTPDSDRRNEQRRFVLFGTCPVYFRDVGQRISKDQLHSNMQFLYQPPTEEYYWPTYSGDMREPNIDLDLQYELMIQNQRWARTSEQGQVVNTGYLDELDVQVPQWCAKQNVLDTQKVTSASFWLAKGVQRNSSNAVDTQVQPRELGKPGLNAPFQFLNNFTYYSQVSRTYDYTIPQRDRNDGYSMHFNLFHPDSEVYVLPYLSGKEIAMVDLCYRTPDQRKVFQEAVSSKYMQLVDIDHIPGKARTLSLTKRQRVVSNVSSKDITKDSNSNTLSSSSSTSSNSSISDSNSNENELKRLRMSLSANLSASSQMKKDLYRISSMDIHTNTLPYTFTSNSQIPQDGSSIDSKNSKKNSSTIPTKKASVFDQPRCNVKNTPLPTHTTPKYAPIQASLFPTLKPTIDSAHKHTPTNSIVVDLSDDTLYSQQQTKSASNTIDLTDD